MVKPGNLSEFLKTSADPVRYPQFGGLLNKETQETLEVRFSSSEETITQLYSGGGGGN